MSSQTINMNNKLLKYGVKLVNRPHIKPTFSIDLSTEEGKEIIQRETEKVLKNHAKTLSKLADM